MIPFWNDRHPDHRNASQLLTDAIFYSGLAKIDTDHEPYRPEKAVFYFHHEIYDPSFVVDISAHFERKCEAVMCYKSQFEGCTEAGELFPTGQPLPELIRTQSLHYGSLIRVMYGEPFYLKETLAVDDIVNMGVKSI